jgi:deoxyribose-phosphate aldolase
MNRIALARLLDHSVLKPEATAHDIDGGAFVVRSWGAGYYCVQPHWVARAAAALADTDSRVISVVGFPHGCDRPESKARATELALCDGAGEIDMVMNIGALKSGEFDAVAADLAAVIRAAQHAPVKVILEMTALTETEKHAAARLALEAGAAFLKTSTGFHSAGGATVADVALLRALAGQAIGVKASGGIRTLADVQAMLAAGANRIGTSATAAILCALPESGADSG